MWTGIVLMAVFALIAGLRWLLEYVRKGRPAASKPVEMIFKILRQPFVALMLFAFLLAGGGALWEFGERKWEGWRKPPELPDGIWDVVDSKGCGNILSKASFDFGTPGKSKRSVHIVGPQWPPSRDTITDVKKKWSGKLLLKFESGREVLWEMDDASRWVSLKWESLGQAREVTLRSSSRSPIQWGAYTSIRSTGL